MFIIIYKFYRTNGSQQNKKKKKLKLLTNKEINDSLKPENYLGATEKIVDKVIKIL